MHFRQNIDTDHATDRLTISEVHPTRREGNVTKTEDITDFDARTAAESLRTFARKAQEWPAPPGAADQLDPQSDLVRSALGLLQDAKHWLGRLNTPFDDFSGDYLLEAVQSDVRIGRDFFVVCLENAAVLLEQVAILVELRPRSMRPAV